MEEPEMITRKQPIMKSHDASHRCQALCRFFITLLAAVMVSSCATTQSNPKAETQSAHAISNSWWKVSSNPPTLYPRGVAADHPTDHHSGDWIYTEDPRGTRFFIPHHGLPAAQRKTLLAEALASRSPEKIRNTTNQEAGRKLGTGAGAVIAAPVLTAGWLFMVIFGGMGAY